MTIGRAICQAELRYMRAAQLLQALLAQSPPLLQSCTLSGEGEDMTEPWTKSGREIRKEEQSQKMVAI